MRAHALAVALAVTALAGCASAEAPAASPSASPEPEHLSYWSVIVRDCDGDYPTGFEILDDEATLTMRTAAYPNPGTTSAVAFCVLDELGMSEADQQRVQQTRALDGRQEADWDGYEATWTYHPDAGLQFVIEQVPFD